ncbi:sigma-70 family RNA polymerase sigma factor [Vandammella animalimorsus]|uniref:Sigma-70 family RNA polymerase sigma factor n=1 Tax=Vandammella animalimorsus TaxID=2029117 RepID=A0A3M6RTI9_9BURK|nr:sigma-70 family RNA polymerase sigma factor [Vandammella animalimorsus]RMX18799.1 sigma-70 family RNA polymerase sigma factor [Vandammella animalimorsus]
MTAPCPSKPVALDVQALAQTWRQPMLRFALLHLQPPEEAEDAVQDALLALLGAQPATLTQGDARHYLFGILKHKITDRLRAKYRPEVAYQDAFEDDDWEQALFDAREHWHEGVAPALWSNPEGQLQSQQFLAVVDACVQRLPPKIARVFSMKELLECDAVEVCDTLGLSKSDYWQCMSRARKQLQLCLSQHWFEQAQEGRQP